MTYLIYALLVLHVASAIIFIGGLTVSASVFPRFATAEAAAPYKDTGCHPVAVEMHRITKGYGRLAIITPVLGYSLALALERNGEAWVMGAIALVLVGGLILVGKVIPMQEQMLREPPTDKKTRSQAMAFAGTLNLIWLAILVLMFTQPA